MVTKEQRRPDGLRDARREDRDRPVDPGSIAEAIALGSFKNHRIAGTKEHGIRVMARRRFRIGVGIVFRARVLQSVRATRTVRVPMLRSGPGRMQMNVRPSIASAGATGTMAERD